MQEISAGEAKETLGALLDRVENGEEIVITRDGKPVARLAPAVEPAIDPEQRRIAIEAFERMRQLARTIDGPPVTLEELKSFRDEGRR
jgi:prevent-host-death family protein